MTFQVGSALLEACVLSVLCDGDAYGYAITAQVQKIIDVSESSLYPVLRRLQKEDCLTTYDQPFQGRNRRYYSLTPLGKVRLIESIREWHSYKAKVDQILLKEPKLE